MLTGLIVPENKQTTCNNTHPYIHWTIFTWVWLWALVSLPRWRTMQILSIMLMVSLHKFCKKYPFLCWQVSAYWNSTSAGMAGITFKRSVYLRSYRGMVFVDILLSVHFFKSVMQSSKRQQRVNKEIHLTWIVFLMYSQTCVKLARRGKEEN